MAKHAGAGRCNAAYLVQGAQLVLYKVVGRAWVPLL